MQIEIKSIPAQNYPEYRTAVMFDGYKWDLQANEQSTISDKVVLLAESDAEFLAQSAVQLYNETIQMEHTLKNNPDLCLQMGISAEMADALCNCTYDPNNHIRFMRFDFHPTTNGAWCISEVNSDVPAGYPEASVLPKLALPYFNDCRQFGSFGDVLKKNLMQLAPAGSTIAYIHDTHTVEDYQILHYLGDMMENEGYRSFYASAEHIQWENGFATNADAIFRYFPVEWLEFTKNTDWKGFVNSQTPSCNHPAALLTQSKRLPLVWDKLGIDIPMWKTLLPETRCPTSLHNLEGRVLKPAFGRVGEGINIPGTVSREEALEIHQAAQKDPLQWVAQKMFVSQPVDGLHLNFGVFVINGEFAGLYARSSSEPKIDEDASEIPVLVKEI